MLFIYCSIGSGLPTVRQHPWLEMTEFQWFHWWPFNVLLLLLNLNLIVVTLRRIPLRRVNLGVWMIHTGIVTLTIGSYYYFATKIEGDAPVFRRKVTIDLPGMTHPEALVALPGNETQVEADGGPWRFAIQDTNSDWPILSDEHKGQRTYAVNVQVTPPEGKPFIRQLLAGYPQYTEDVIPGEGRAVKSTGKKLLRDDLNLSLDYHGTTAFQVMDTWAIFVRRVGDTEWHERPLDGLPRYHERIASRDQVFTDPHFPIAVRPIDLAVEPTASDDPLRSASVHVTGYLRYAHMERRWRDGGERLNPVLELSVVSGAQREQTFELLALDPLRSVAGDGNVQFVWLPDSSQLESLPRDSRAILHLAMPASNVDFDLPLTPELIGADFRPIEGTDFSFRVVNVQDRLSIPGQDRAVSIVMTDVKTPDGTFQRWVADRPEVTRDRWGQGSDPHAVENREPDPRIQMTYRPASAPLIFAAHPGGVRFVFNGRTGREREQEVKIGEPLEVVPGLILRVDSLVVRGVPEVKPFVVPPRSRENDAGETYAMIRLEVNAGREVQSKWLHFNRYVFPGGEYGYGGRFAYHPERFRLADGGEVEVLFSRKRLPLPSPIAMEDFQLDTHLGGYTGSTSTIRNYVSRLRFLDHGKWTDPQSIAVNSPTEHGGYWYFQSTWDRPSSNAPGGGMNYTGLGIGNRNGVYVQLAGCCLSVLGMIYAFYVKPMLKTRRREQSRAKVSPSSHRPLAPVAGETAV